MQIWQTSLYMPAIITPTLQFRPNCLIQYDSYDYYDCDFKRKRQDEFSANLNTFTFEFFHNDESKTHVVSAANQHKAAETLLNLFPGAEIDSVTKDKSTYKGLLCEGAKKRLRRAMDNLILISERKTIFNTVTNEYQSFRLAFITLTVGCERIVDPKEVKKKCLEPFLRWLVRTKKCLSYVHKAEFQERGQIHFHITTNNFVDYRDVRAKWNELQFAAGYLDDYIRKFCKGHIERSWIDIDGRAGKSWIDCPGTDARSVREPDKMGNYMIKQVDKDINLMSEYLKDCQNKQSVNGKVWDCSVNLKVKRFETEADYRYLTELEEFVTIGEVEKIVLDTCTIYKSDSINFSLILSEVERFRYRSWVDMIRDKEEVIKVKAPIIEPYKPVIKRIAQLNIFSTS